MTALSPDLRQRVVAFYAAHRGKGASYDSVAKHFAIGYATVSRWLRLKRETGQVVDRPRKVVVRSPIDMAWLKAHTEANPDATLKERAAAHQKAHGGKVPSVPAMWMALRRLNFTHKKRHSTRRSGSWSTSARRERLGSQSSRI